MTEPQPAADIELLEQALTRVAYLITRARRHDEVKHKTGLPLDRASAMMLRQLAESSGVRPGELAAQLEVEAPHVTRQVQRLRDGGYVERIADPADSRACLIRLTPSGRQAAGQIREAGRNALRETLTGWSQRDVHHLATLFGRMAADLTARAASDAAG